MGRCGQKSKSEQLLATSIIMNRNRYPFLVAGHGVSIQVLLKILETTSK
jgi:hypothetical protein